MSDGRNGIFTFLTISFCFQQILAIAVCLFGLAHASAISTGVANYGGYGAGYGLGHGATSYVNRVDNIGYGGYARGYAGYAHAPAVSYVARVDNNGYRGAYNGAWNGYNGAWNGNNGAWNGNNGAWNGNNGAWNGYNGLGYNGLGYNNLGYGYNRLGAYGGYGNGAYNNRW